MQDDHIESTTDYSAIHKKLKEYNEKRAFFLLETLAHFFVENLIKDFSLKNLHLIIEKPEAFSDGTIPSVEVIV